MIAKHSCVNLKLDASINITGALKQHMLILMPKSTLAASHAEIFRQFASFPRSCCEELACGQVCSVPSRGKP